MTAAFGLGLLVLALLASRQPIVLLLIAASSYIHLVWGDGDLTYLIDDMWTAISHESLLAIPMFILAGALMTRGSIARRLITIMRAATQWLPGGLAVACILSCAIFAAISGASAVTMLAVGSVMYPALIADGYKKGFALGAIASGGTLGIIIPPSIPMVLFAIVTEKSIVDMFVAGLVPGILLALVMCGYALIVNRNIAAKPFSLAELGAALRQGIWALMLPVVLLGGIYTGYFSATEAAAVAVGYALLVEIFIHRELGPKDFAQTAQETAVLLGSLFPIVAVALSLNLLLTAERVPQELAAWVAGVVESRITFLLFVNLLLLAVGCFVDTMSALLVLAPILLPMAEVFGIDPIHFGIIMVVNLEIGMLTPPMGLNLIVAMTAFKTGFGTVIRGSAPFILLMIGVLMLVTYLPAISLSLVR
jgi:C4-dicarboxylate transporter DctM subunit